MDSSLSRTLHALVLTLDRAADRILRADHGIGYPQLMLLYAVEECRGGTQRDVAQWLGRTEAPVSRSLRSLAEGGLVAIAASPGAGHRRQVSLSTQGRRVLHTAGADLERRLAVVVASARLDYATYADMTDRLLHSLSGGTSEDRS